MKATITKSLGILAFILISAGFASAQSFNKGTNVVSAGIGLGSSLWSTGAGKISPALSVNYEKGIWEVDDIGVISLGGYLGRTSATYSDAYLGYSWSQKHSYTVVGARSAFHYSQLNNDKFDIYGGLMLSYNILSVKYDDNYTGSTTSNSYGASGMGITGFVGGRYWLSDNIGAFGELGYGVSYLTLGVSLKF